MSGEQEGPELPQNAVNGLRLTESPKDPRWALRWRPGDATVGILGWMMSAAPVEGGVPATVARILAETLCRVARVTFIAASTKGRPSSDDWVPVEEGWRCKLSPPTVRRLTGAPVFPLVCTTEPRLARALFEVPGFAWELRAQVVLLSPLEKPPPHVTYQDVQDLFGQVVLERRTARLGADIVGLMLPGVDGDFVELISFAPDGWQRLRDRLSATCSQARVAFDIVPEPGFARTEWFSAHPTS